MIRLILKNILLFFLIIFLQVFAFDKIQLGGFINPYFYVIFILLLPFETSGWVLLFSSFFLGLSIDLFSQTLGMHASACTLMAFLRPTVLKAFSPKDGYELGTSPRILFYGLNWFVKYAMVLILVHHFVLFYIEMFRFSDFFYTLFRVILSSLFTGLLIVLSQFFIFRR